MFRGGTEAKLKAKSNFTFKFAWSRLFLQFLFRLPFDIFPLNPFHNNLFDFDLLTLALTVQ